MQRKIIKTEQSGFTLVEVAIAVVILGLLLGGAMMTLTAQMDLKNNAETMRTLEAAQEAILGFAAANGRLPCPSINNGQEAPVVAAAVNNQCTNGLGDGFVPAAVLGLTPVDNTGRLIDAWGMPIRYAVTRADGNAYTTPDGVANAGLRNLAADPKLVICNGACGGAGTILTDRAIFVLYSSGIDMAVNDAENLPPPVNSNFIFPSPGAASDDLMVWTSPYTLYNRMLAAGAL